MGAGNGGAVAMGEGSGYDPMFGTLPTNAFSSPAAWHGEDAGAGAGGPGGVGAPNKMGGMAPAAPSPGARSNGESAGTGGEEKDPFLSLLEQLADGQRQGDGLGDFDFFFGAGGTSA